MTYNITVDYYEKYINSAYVSGLNDYIRCVIKSNHNRAILLITMNVEQSVILCFAYVHCSLGIFMSNLTHIFRIDNFYHNIIENVHCS